MVEPAQPIQQQQTPVYQAVPPLEQLSHIVLGLPSIPYKMKMQFMYLWELPPLGNFDDKKKDIEYLMLKFKEWCIFMTWYIPDSQWGNIHKFTETDREIHVEMDLNMLLNMLEQAYYIQLTRGRGGFATKELTSIRTIGRNESEAQPEKKGWRLF